MFRTKQQLLDRLNSLPLGGLWVFVVEQSWAALFGGLLLIAVIATQFVAVPGISRYDFLFIFALVVQVFMLVTKLEKPHEVITIMLFHLVGIGMELFKTSHAIQSWNYPGEALFKIGNVPLFSGFMYAAVGSYIARSRRILQLQFSHYPPRYATIVLALAIYANFFTHHYIYDIRGVLFAITTVLFGPVTVRYTVNNKTRRMPLVIGFGLIAGVIWLAENIGTYTGAWLYPNQHTGWHIVSIDKIGSWFLLMIISFIMADVLHALRLKFVLKTN